MDPKAAVLPETSISLLTHALSQALAGSDEEWAQLHHRCDDPHFAARFRAALLELAPQAEARLRHWVEVIDEIHPCLSQNVVASREPTSAS